ncbi:TPA: peptide-methionine (S)-S-oxide reductase MsrA [Enterococcus faecium]
MLDVEQMEIDLYNIILNRNTREWERTQFEEAKEDLAKMSIKQVIEKLEVNLRPLALRDNLTPDAMDFYLRITGESASAKAYDYAKHKITSPLYQERAIFAGGCFWCMVEPFETKPGVISVLSGYTGGETKKPNYDQVSGGYTGHVEAVEIIFDTRQITYEELLEIYWQISDPTDAFGQFQDRGKQYRSILFVVNEKQRQLAEKSREQLIQSNRFSCPIVTEIRQAKTFWPAENHHQQFYQKQPKRYKKIKHSHQLHLFFQRHR